MWDEILNQFARTAWGHPELFFKKETSPDAGVIEFIDLGEHSFVLRYLFPGNLRDSKVLVRDEYHVALGALQEDRYHHGAHATGQSGIGKTYFLVYLIVHFLGQKNAVALQHFQTRPAYYVFFTDQGVSTQSSAVHDSMDDFPGLIWALSDSNHITTSPALIFPHLRKRMRIIQTTLPDYSYWGRWSEQVGARRYVMDIWSVDEIRKHAVLSQSNVERMTELATKWGGDLRTIRHWYPTPDRVVEDAFRYTAGGAVFQCKMMLSKGPECDVPECYPKPFYFIRPKKIPGGHTMKPYVSVPTRTLRCLLAEDLRENKTVMLEFFHALGSHAEMRLSAAYIYESWFHSFFSTKAKKIQCNWIAPDLQDDGTQTLSSTTALVSSAGDVPPSWTPPLYWLPPVRNFPGIDSALILANEIIAFQVTIIDHHRASPKKGLSELRDRLPDNLKNLPWKLVFVGLEDDRLKDIAKTYVGEIFFPTNEACVRVGWSMVDPVQRGVVYKHYRDEDDPAPEEPM